MPVPQYDGVPVDMIIRRDGGTVNQIIIFSPAKPPGNTPIKLPGNSLTAPGTTFHITGVTATIYQNGTSCSNPARYTVTTEYTGDPTGRTINIYTSNEGGPYEYWIDAVDPTVSHIVSQAAYWSKPNSVRTIIFRVREDGNPTNEAFSEERGIEGVVCGL